MGGKSKYIEHGKTTKERKNYAVQLKDICVSYYENGIWQNPRPQSNLDVVLVEVWQGNGDVIIHPSRNPFFSVTIPDKKSVLHGFSTNPNTMKMFESGRRAYNRHIQIKPLAVPKSKIVPSWAKEENIIGYTAPQPIVDFSIFGLASAGLESCPSIYYKDGHATMDHDVKGNVGWEFGQNYTMLFFGNVPREYVTKPH